MARRILFLTGEVSGDLQAAYLLKALKIKDPDLIAYAIGGDMLQDAGAHIIENITSRSTIGFLEVARHIPALLILKKKVIAVLDEYHIDHIVCVDYQGFNMMIARIAKLYGIKVTYYIPPQEWVWGSDKGMRKVVEITDKIIAIFKDEYEAYRKFTDHVRYFGHPLIDIIQDWTQAHPKPKKTRGYISFFPGSRLQEIKHILPEMVNIMNHLLMDGHDQLILNLPNDAHLKLVRKILGEIEMKVQLTIGQNYEVLSNSVFSVVASGTVTLEATILEVPHMVLYRFHPVSFPLIKRVLKKRFKYPYFSLTNIIAGEEVVPEYLQNIPAGLMAEQIHYLLNQPKELKLKQKQLNLVKEALQVKGHHNILDSIAQYLLSEN